MLEEINNDDSEGKGRIQSIQQDEGSTVEETEDESGSSETTSGSEGKSSETKKKVSNIWSNISKGKPVIAKHRGKEKKGVFVSYSEKKPDQVKVRLDGSRKVSLMNKSNVRIKL